ncbi:MFS transporter [Ornithinimicrobium sp. Arc0846-15]|nr:MFS transporter [Ornithinimicrobium laminariae]
MLASTSLLRHRDFRLLWAGDTVSVLGIQMIGIAIPIIAINDLGASTFQMGVLNATETIGFLLFSLLAGAWIDRWIKRPVIVLGDLIRSVLLLGVPLLWWLDMLAMWHIYVISLAVGIVTVFFEVANQSFLPFVVDGNKISDANGKFSATNQVARVAGPAAGGALVGVIGGPLTLIVTAICMAASSLFVSQMKTVELKQEAKPGRSLKREIGEGLQFVFKHPLLVRITTCTGISNFANGFWDAAFAIFILRTLGLSPSTFGLILAVGAVGGLFGAVSAAPLSKWIGEGRSIPLTALAVGFAAAATPLASLGLTPAVATLMVGSVLFAWAVVVYNVVQVSFRQRLCPPRLLGRMNASIRFLVWGPIPIGALAGGAFGTIFGVVPTLWVGVVLFAAASAPVFFSPLRWMRDLPRELDALADGDEPSASAT